MRHFDLSPLYRSTVGFDRLASMLDGLTGPEGNNPAYPPYNIERLDENAYRITMAIAGFTADDLTIETHENVLTIAANKAESEADENREFLHRGIAARNFERRFQLADYVEVSAANLENGLLNIDLKREIPEAMKPRTIDIATGKGTTIDQQIAHTA